MKLHYNAEVKDSREPIVLTRGAHRIEFFVRLVDEHYWHLIGLAGNEEQPSKDHCQGPYQQVEEACGSRSAIVQSLIDDHYCLSDQAPQWSLQAQRRLKENRQQRLDGKGDYSFSPDDVFFDLE